MHITRHRRTARPLRLVICGTAGAALIAAAGTAAGAVAPAAAHQGLTVPLKYRGPLLSVSADSPTDAWSVGIGVSGESAVVHWNGTSVAKVHWPSPATNTLLDSVSAVSADDAWAVGGTPAAGGGKTFIIQWNGTHWARVPSPSPPATISKSSGLQGVSADSATDAWAVGTYESTSSPNPLRTLILHWNGAAWTRVPSPNPGPVNSFLSGVSADSPTDAWAVGTYQTRSFAIKTLILHWNGTAWHKVPTPNPGGISDGGTMTGISASSPTDAWATGSYTTSGGVTDSLTLHWGGTRWVQVTTPNPGGTHATQLSGVTDFSPTDAWAVGLYETGNAGKVPMTLALHWDGTSWTQVTTPNPGGPGGSSLNSVSGTSSTDLWAVGTYNPSGHPGEERDQGLVLHWDGTGWTQF